MTTEPVVYRVIRDSGRSTGEPRLLYAGDESEARRIFRAESERLRQGAVELSRDDGTVLARVTAPRLRLRW